MFIYYRFDSITGVFFVLTLCWNLVAEMTTKNRNIEQYKNVLLMKSLINRWIHYYAFLYLMLNIDPSLKMYHINFCWFNPFQYYFSFSIQNMYIKLIQISQNENMAKIIPAFKYQLLAILSKEELSACFRRSYKIQTKSQYDTIFLNSYQKLQ
jgi:hypothetical protein